MIHHLNTNTIFNQLKKYKIRTKLTSDITLHIFIFSEYLFRYHYQSLKSQKSSFPVLFL